MRKVDELPDVQNEPDKTNIPVGVGIKGHVVEGYCGGRSVPVKVSAFIRTSKKGANLSRFAECFTEPIQLTTERVIDKAVELMEVHMSYWVSLGLKFKLPMEDDHIFVGCGYDVTVDGPEGTPKAWQVMSVPVATVCPCSLAMSEGKSAHAQKAFITARCLVEVGALTWRELYGILRVCGSAPTYTIVKRDLENELTEKMFGNPKFVEDVVRSATLRLRDLPKVKGFNIMVESLESIHPYSVVSFRDEKANDG